jgi:hypothetical protein
MSTPPRIITIPSCRCVVCGMPVRIPGARLCDRHVLIETPAAEMNEAA